MVDKLKAVNRAHLGPSHRGQTGTVTGAGVIAAGHPLTAQAGADVLRAGGNAIDAAIAGTRPAVIEVFEGLLHPLRERTRLGERQVSRLERIDNKPVAHACSIVESPVHANQYSTPAPSRQPARLAACGPGY